MGKEKKMTGVLESVAVSQYGKFFDKKVPNQKILGTFIKEETVRSQKKTEEDKQVYSVQQANGDIVKFDSRLGAVVPLFDKAKVGRGVYIHYLGAEHTKLKGVFYNGKMDWDKWANQKGKIKQGQAKSYQRFEALLVVDVKKFKIPGGK
jgi:hypothetical protein